MKNKINLAIICSILIVFFIIFIFLLFFYFSFMEERLAFELTKNQTYTKITNHNFDISFVVQKKCNLKSRFTHHDGGGVSLFSGYLYCEGVSYPLDIGVIKYRKSKYSIVGNYQNNSRFFGGEWRKNVAGNNIFTLDIVDEAKNKVLVISGDDSNKDVIEDMLQSITEL